MRPLQPCKFAKASLASLLVGFVLLISLAASSPAIHNFIHSDSADADHHCVVEMFAHGHVDSAAAAPVFAALAVLFAGVAVLSETLVFSQADYRFSLSRAPPV